VRKQVYRSVFAGACGVTYGHNSVWGFAGVRNHSTPPVDRDWIDGLQRPAGRQMQFLRDLIESRPFFGRMPDMALILGDSGVGGRHMAATRDRDGSYAFVFLPESDQAVTLDLASFAGKQLRAWWYDPRAGIGTPAGNFLGGAKREFRSPPYGPDWVLVLDDESAGYPPPGLSRWQGSAG
jgi:hypothetical protein